MCLLITRRLQVIVNCQVTFAWFVPPAWGRATLEKWHLSHQSKFSFQKVLRLCKFHEALSGFTGVQPLQALSVFLEHWKVAKTFTGGGEVQLILEQFRFMELLDIRLSNEANFQGMLLGNNICEVCWKFKFPNCMVANAALLRGQLVWPDFLRENIKLKVVMFSDCHVKVARPVEF